MNPCLGNVLCGIIDCERCIKSPAVRGHMFVHNVGHRGEKC